MHIHIICMSMCFTYTYYMLIYFASGRLAYYNRFGLLGGADSHLSTLIINKYSISILIYLLYIQYQY